MSCLFLTELFSHGPWANLRLLENNYLRNLTSDLTYIVLQDKAFSTTKKYLNSFSRWRNWATRHKLPYLPAQGHHIALYLVHLIRTAKSPCPIRDAVYGITWAHTKAGLDTPTHHHFVKQVVQAANRLLSKPVKRKLPLKLSQVKSLIVKYDKTGTSLKLLQTLLFIVIGFAGFLRWSDLISIKVQNIHFHDSYMSIFLPKRKNDQFRKGGWVYFWRSRNRTCPVSLMERFLAKTQLSSGLLLRAISGPKLQAKPLTYSKARKQFLEMLQSINVNSKLYGLHSLRSGGASRAAALGISGRLISRHGAWRTSSARNRYIRETLYSRLHITRRLGL